MFHLGSGIALHLGGVRSIVLPLVRQVAFWYYLPMAARARSKSKSKRTVIRKRIRVAEPIAASSPSPLSRIRTDSSFRKKVLIGAIIIALAAGAFYKKDWFVAATVNGSPITNWELQSRLNKDYKNQVLQQMVNEKIVLAEARSKNALPNQQEIDARIAEIESRFGGADNFNNFLSQQDQTRSSIRDKVTLELAVEKLYSADVQISAEEIEKFIKDSPLPAGQNQSTDPAAQATEAEKSLRQQKLSQIFLEKFQELKEKANIKIF